MDWNGIWNTIKNFFTNNAWAWKIVLFFAVFVIGFILIKIIMNIARKLLGKTKMERIAQQFLCAILKFVLYLVFVLMLLKVVGVDISGIITACSAIILAIGLALENCIANLATGIIIVATHMFKKGDYVIAGGYEGNITDINFLFTTIMTVDNKKVTVPNNTILNSSVVNAGANKTRRVDFTFSVAYETDVELVKKIVVDVMKSNGNVLLDPAPFCRLKTLGSSSIDFFANCWCDNCDYWDTYYYVMENVYNEFKRHNISIPYAQMEVRNRNDKVVMPVIKAPLQKRVEKVRDEHEKFNLETASFAELLKPKKSKEKQAKIAEEKTEKQKAKELKAKEKADKKAEKKSNKKTDKK